MSEINSVRQMAITETTTPAVRTTNTMPFTVADVISPVISDHLLLAENLLPAANGEHEEWSALYPGFANVAREEGFKAVATIFEMISVAEKQHERRYRGLLDTIQNGRVFQRGRAVKWRCLNCGYVHEGPDTPAACPACAHPQAYFELLGENW